jgi:hypothetical protein
MQAHGVRPPPMGILPRVGLRTKRALQSLLSWRYFLTWLFEPQNPVEGCIGRLRDCTVDE